MIKKNKGFTLIELLAVIVITGVLTALIVPKISNMVLETRLKIYLQDAKKMVSQVQYKMSSNTVDIEKPEIGECIVFSLGYLDGNELKTGPNDGEYIKKSSFVVVKNEDGVFDYAVMLVEARNDGLYQGVEFVTENILNASDAVKHVRFFDSYDIRVVHSDTEEEQDGVRYLDTDYINEQLARAGAGTIKWVEDDSIARAYTSKGDDPEVILDAASPKFSAKVVPKESGGVGVLDATLTVNATDSDDALNTLTVCTRISPVDDNKFPNVNTTPDLCEPYGDLNYYSKDINFRDYGLDYDNNSIGYVYITVSDPSGHASRKLREYNIHKNEGPKVKMWFERLPNQKADMPTTNVVVNVADDINATRELEVCFDQDYESASGFCTGTYYEFNYYFKGENKYQYTFKDVNGNPIEKPDGSSHSLTMYVRDKEGKTTVTTEYYKIYKNNPPEIRVIPYQEPLETRNNEIYYSLNYSLDIYISDDLSNNNEIMIQIENGPKMTYAEFLTDYMLNPDLEGYMFTAPGELDGKDREVLVKVWDQYQDAYDYTGKSVKLTHILDKKPPGVKLFRVVGNEIVCMHGSGYNKYCLSGANNKDGAYSVKFNLRLDENYLPREEMQERVKVCVSINKEDCVYSPENYNRFIPYYSFINSSYHNTYHFEEPDSLKKYVKKSDGTYDIRKVYLNVVDIQNSWSNNEYYEASQPYLYTIYANKAPEFASSEFYINKADSDKSSIVVIDAEKVKVYDDFDNYTMSFCYRMVYDPNDNVTEYKCHEDMMRPEQFREIFNGNTQYELKDNYGKSVVAFKGQIVQAYFKATDHMGETSETKKVEYSLFNEDAPRFDNGNPFISGSKFGGEGGSETGGSNEITVRIKAIDSGDRYSVCVKLKENEFTECGNNDFTYNNNGSLYYAGPTSKETGEAKIPINGEITYKWDQEYNEEERDKTFIIAIKDQSGLIDTKEVHYNVYKACTVTPFKGEKTSDYPAMGVGITTSSCRGLCYTNLSDLNDDTYSELPINTTIANYIKEFRGLDPKVKTRDLNCVRTTDYTKDCSDISCFTVPDKDKYDTTYISLLRRNPSDEWQDETGEQEDVITYAEDKVCKDLIDGSKKDFESNFDDDTHKLFSLLDYRCNEIDSYCNNAARSVCGLSSGSCYDDKMVTCRQIADDICIRNPSLTLDLVGNSVSAALEKIKNDIIAANPEKPEEELPISESELMSKIVVKSCNKHSTNDEYALTRTCRNSAPYCVSRDEVAEWYRSHDVVDPEDIPDWHTVHADEDNPDDPGESGENGNTDPSPNADLTDGEDGNTDEDEKGKPVVRPVVMTTYYVRNESCVYLEKDNPNCNVDSEYDYISKKFSTVALDNSSCSFDEMDSDTCRKKKIGTGVSIEYRSQLCSYDDIVHNPTCSRANAQDLCSPLELDNPDTMFECRIPIGEDEDDNESNVRTSAVGVWHMNENIEIPASMYESSFKINWTNDYLIDTDDMFIISSDGLESPLANGILYYSLESNSWLAESCRVIHISGGEDANNQTLIQWLLANSEEGNNNTGDEEDSELSAIGTWHMNETLNIHPDIYRTFDITWQYMYNRYGKDFIVESSIFTFESNGITSDQSDGDYFYDSRSQTWFEPGYNVIVITGGEDVNNKDFVEWLLANSEEGFSSGSGDEPIEEDPQAYCPDAYKDENGECAPLCDANANINDVMNNKCMPRSREQFLSYYENCVTQVYQKHDCTKSIDTVNKTITCHGEYYSYKMRDKSPCNGWWPFFCSSKYYQDQNEYPNANYVFEIKTKEEDRICPELVAKYPERYVYDPDSGKNYVLFDPRIVENYPEYGFQEG